MDQNKFYDIADRMSLHAKTFVALESHIISKTPTCHAARYLGLHPETLGLAVYEFRLEAKAYDREAQNEEFDSTQRSRPRTHLKLVVSR